MGEDLLHVGRDVGDETRKKEEGEEKRKNLRKPAIDIHPSHRDINFPRLYTVQVFLARAHEIVCRHRPMEILF